jgi:ribosomal protein L37AE/L43A
LDELLASWASHDHTTTEGTCVVCEGETFRVELRGGVRAWACRECGSVLEDEPAVLTV